MSELVLAANKSAALPFESVEAFRADEKKLRALLKSDSIEEVERGIKEVLPAIARKIEAAKRPINPTELATELAMVVAAFPNSKANEDFVAILINSVAVMRPSIGAVMLARRHLIFSAKFLPAISEVREAIEKATDKIAYLEREVRWVPRHLESMKKSEAQRLIWEREEREQKERRERELKQAIEENARRRATGKEPVCILSDDEMPGMFRIKYADGTRSDAMGQTEAREAAWGSPCKLTKRTQA
jgi:hypothetical protein